MARIQNSSLSITNIPGTQNALAFLSYEVAWDPGDVGVFFHSVALRGQDPVSDDDLAPMSPTPGWSVAGGPPVIITAVAVVNKRKLDEDRDINLFFVALRNKDAVYARMNVIPFTGIAVEADSNTVRADFGS